MDRPRFLVEAPLSRLCKWLRVLGYDAHFVPPTPVDRLVAIAQAEGRTVLSARSGPSPLMRQGTWEEVRPGEAAAQLRQVVDRFDLDLVGNAFSRCIECNVPLLEAPREEVWAVVPEFVYRQHPSFRRCPQCGRVFWPGTHVQRMQAVIGALEKPHRDSP